MENFSVLKFTYELEKRKKLSFLDVLLERKNDTLQTSVHIKETNSGECMNYNSVAPEKYKLGVLKTFLNRAYSISSSWEVFNIEIERIK